MKTPDFFKRSELTSALWAFRREFFIVGAFSMIANVLMLTPTLYMLQVYDRVLSSQSELTLIAMSLLTLFLFAVMAFAEWMRSRLLVSTGVRLDEQLSTQVFNASFEAHLSQSGASPSRAFGDLIQIRQFLTGNGIFAFFDAPWTPIYMAVLFFLHPMLGVLGIVFALIQAALAWFGHRHTLAPSEAATKAGADASTFLQGKLRNAEVLESMGMVHNLRDRWAARHQLHLSTSGDAQQLQHRIMAVSKFIRYTQQSLSLGAGALLVIDGQLSPGGMIAANVLMTRALAPIDMMVGSWRQFIGMRFAFARLEQMLIDYPERDPALKRVAPTGAVTLQDVFATAPGRADPILKNINLSVPAGTVTAVLGPSGSGKSTLARVLMGIWPDRAGTVLLDQLPIEGWNRVELGPYLGYLPQDIELFEGSIAENIARFGEVDPAKVIEAAQSAGLHDMILRFPKGYDTPIGEAGNLLSGGQRQRIGLARAVYGNPQLVVLDEPNANLDDAGEAALFKTIAQLKAKGSTVFLITHRPGAISVADRLLILRDGQVVANGPRDAVIAAMQAPRPAPTNPAVNPATVSSAQFPGVTALPA
ncbi:type I secretion system permease/ATPase [Rhodoferax sp.]|uniref:type I secretion system permease/ATPase n=1 Tax=Rhodoferax sp. TaxID=50421 RepID=UPI002609C988|nr:type I secretion system permease/ATPase [Rhodoferax sp.]MDD2811446.1 type I secretion system permease/ATPase [Rhodoferax sp.]MDD4944560.1 type I secretion system permease/ATPase [Rhodoferax sp.]